MRVTPLGKVEQLSTHDQLLGGASGLTFIGSVFPASDEYAREIAVEALKVGDALAGVESSAGSPSTFSPRGLAATGSRTRSS